MLPKILVATILMWGFLNSAWAECSAAQVRQLLKQGLNDAEIDARCQDKQGLPGWLSGDWDVAEATTRSNVPGLGVPPTYAVWRLQVAGQGLRIVEIGNPLGTTPGLEHMSQEQPLEIRNLQFSGGSLTFATRRNIAGAILTTEYRLDLSDSEQDSIDGQWRSKDSGMMAGIFPATEMSGTVKLVKR